MQYLWFGLPAGYEDPPPTPTFHNHPSALHHSSDVAAYILKELRKRAMVGPFDHPPFTPWTQTNPLLSRPRKDYNLHQVIMDLSWPLPLGVSVNGCTPKESFLGIHKKMHLPSASDFYDLIRKASRGSFLFATDMARAYRQLPLDPRDWPLVCFTFEGQFYLDISLLLGLRWAASHCQDATNLVSRELRSWAHLTPQLHRRLWGGGSPFSV